jgi:hypothetical protein
MIDCHAGISPGGRTPHAVGLDKNDAILRVQFAKAARCRQAGIATADDQPVGPFVPESSRAAAEAGRMLYQPFPSS